jgi:hypothetical protein
MIEFADGWVIYCSSTNEEIAKVKLQKTLKNLETWIFEKGFQFAAQKCETIVDGML